MSYGGIEAGGTKWVCGVGDGQGEVSEAIAFPTGSPQETLAQAVSFFEQHGPLHALGVGSFGPVDVRRGSPTFGRIAGTPKPGWSQTDVAATLAQRLGLPVALDTDVNAALIGELRWGSGAGFQNVVYITVGTGIGGGVLANGRLVHGLLHPELGHMRIPHDRALDPFPGCCPFHGDCLEGLASGEAIRQRCGERAERITDPAVWELEARYLAHAITNISYVLSPERVIVGGGVINAPGLLAQVRTQVRELVGGYPDASGVLERVGGEEFIVTPGLGNRAGVLGALALARDLHRGAG